MSENTNANTSETANEPEMPDFTEAWRQWATSANVSAMIIGSSPNALR